jgi:protein pelota
MKIIHRDMKEQKIKLAVETPEDLWHLEHVIEAGDLVTSRTLRKASIKRGGEYEYGDKKPVVLTIKVEKMELKKDSGILRLNGPIAAGPDDVPLQSHHSIEVEAGSVLSIQKTKWKSYQIDRLEKAKTVKQSLLICVMDREEADFAVLRESGIEMKAKITNYDRENMEEYYEKIISYLKGRDFRTMVIGGPGFERENILKYMREKHKDLAGRIMLEHSSSTGINGVQEIIKKSGSRVLKETRIAKESEYVSEILRRMKTDGLVVYGTKETEKAVESAAVETLFVSQEKLNEFEGVMETQERLGGKIVIIGSDHELGEQFLHLGGVAGFLRFRAEF